nr:Shedu anti-phage system protein SduA domain-containing protein [Actinopolyspora halophila]
MEIRTDAALEWQLKRTEQEATTSEVKQSIADVIAHMHSGQEKNRRGGQALLRLLEQARLRASEENEWDIVCLLHEAHGYATGRILKPDFDERYRLIKDGKRRDSLQNFVAGTLSRTLQFISEAGNEYLAEHPDADTSDLLNYVSALGEDAQLLDAPGDTPGRYRVVRGRAELAAWLQRTLSDRVDLDTTEIENPAEIARRLARSPKALTILAQDTDGQSVFKLAELKQRSDTLTEIRKLVDDPTAGEGALQDALYNQPWIFGGRFVEAATRRSLVDGDELDIPLIRADGALHVVELKRALNLSGIVKRHRNAWVPTAEVHDAVGQAINYLAGLDEERQRISEEFGLETKRASATVVIGHPKLHPNVPEHELNEALRTLNTHTNRVEVLTYPELLDNAVRALGNTPTP